MKLSQILITLFTVLILTSCENEDVDDMSQISALDLIAEESELFDLLNRVASDDGSQEELTCIKFIYAFTVVTYNENLEVVNSAIVANDTQFYQYLQEVGENELINVSFPITSVDEEGNTFEVNNKEELATAIADCKDIIEEQLIGECTGLLLECVWEVAIPEDVVFSTYTDAVFDVANDGTVNFFYRGVAYEGTWIVYIIDEGLHININLNDDSDVGLGWNFDWKTEIIDNSEMRLNNDSGDVFVLKKECEAENYCTTLTFTECEDEDTPSFAAIDPNDYSDCVIVIAAPQQEFNEDTGELSNEIAWEVSYYLTVEDAETAVNTISGPLTVENDGSGIVLQTRIENPDAQEFSVVEVTLQAAICN